MQLDAFIVVEVCGTGNREMTPGESMPSGIRTALISYL